MTETKELLRLLFRREDVVSQIRDGPIDIRSLTEAVDVSRPTVHRSLKSLQQHDVIEETSEGYLLTSYGELVFERYRTTIEEFDDVRENRSLLLALEGTTAVSEAFLDGARYIRALPFAPEQPIGEIESVVRDATVVRAFSPVVVGRYVSLFHEQLTTSTLDVEALTMPVVYEYLRSNWTDKLDESIDAGMTFRLTDEPLPFGLIIAEEPVETVCVIVYDDTTLRGVIRNDSPAAVAWARELYDSYYQTTRQPESSGE